MSPEHSMESPFLVIGAAKSGKSVYAEEIIRRHEPDYVYVATSQILDGEMEQRVRVHRERRKEHWETIECPFELPDTLRTLKGTGRPVLVDCITLWLSNLLCFSPITPEAAVDALCDSVCGADYPLVIVSNEVGAGIVPENALARKFRDLAGATNQRLAQICLSVTMVVAGLPLRLK
ncbi:MAG: bifunctional adenosylcobinamide kinase/adenosylcobinamide-phosphate guanylyltransferase [Desulfobacteraceae bacterium]|nr:bifunctional adenosylcobinamide kinase/adenosylcobinamide-phosphate guanylyltransferase [Desulfobacteraceae bacterium]